MDKILKYFPNITERQQQQFAELKPLYSDWNGKINVISRKDIDNIYLHHVLHSLAIAKEVSFRPGSRILDIGTGGGFPGIPLAIMFPDCHFKMIDRTAKKIKVVNEIASALGLKNVKAVQLPGEEEHEMYDFVVSRAVMSLPDLMRIVRKNISKSQHNSVPNGLICLKGGNIDNEVQPFGKILEISAISNTFDEDWFKDKYIIYVPV